MIEPKWVVKKAIPNEDYTLSLEFADGKRGVYDARPLLEEKLYEQLKSKQLFMMARVAFDTVVWAEDIDIAPEHLYENCKETYPARVEPERNPYVAEIESDYKPK